MTAVAAYLAVVVAFAAVCCGHHGEEFPIPWRRRTARHPPAELPFPALIASRRRPKPSWALPSDTEAESASPSHESESMEKR